MTPQGRKFQSVQANGMHYHKFVKWWCGMHRGTEVELRRDKGNPHDARAVAVYFNGDQIAWVPKAANAGIAGLLDEGRKLRAFVTLVNQDALHFDVYVDAQPRMWALPKASVQGADPHIGTCALLHVRTTATRTSCDLWSSNQRMGWFRKAEFTDDIPDGAVAVIYPGQGWTIYASKEDLPDELLAALKSAPTLTTSTPTAGTLTGYTVTHIQTEKETTMSLTDKANTIVTLNKSAAAQAGYLEAGRIANNQLVKISAKALPLMARGYADTPVGKLVLANIAQIAAGHLRAGDQTLAKLTNAMTVAAYQELIQTFDIEGWLTQVMESPEIKRAVSKLGADETKAE